MPTQKFAYNLRSDSCVSEQRGRISERKSRRLWYCGCFIIFYFRWLWSGARIYVVNARTRKKKSLINENLKEPTRSARNFKKKNATRSQITLAKREFCSRSTDSRIFRSPPLHTIHLNRPKVCCQPYARTHQTQKFIFFFLVWRSIKLNSCSRVLVFARVLHRSALFCTPTDTRMYLFFRNTR